jgi:hypothetical protein
MTSRGLDVGRSGQRPIPAPMTTTPIRIMTTPVSAAPWALIQSRAATSRGSIRSGDRTVASVGAATPDRRPEQ